MSSSTIGNELTHLPRTHASEADGVAAPDAGARRAARCGVRGDLSAGTSSPQPVSSWETDEFVDDRQRTHTSPTNPRQRARRRRGGCSPWRGGRSAGTAGPVRGERRACTSHRSPARGEQGSRTSSPTPGTGRAKINHELAAAREFVGDGRVRQRSATNSLRPRTHASEADEVAGRGRVGASREGAWGRAWGRPVRGGRRSVTSSPEPVSSSETDEFVDDRQRTHTSPTNSQCHDPGAGAGARAERERGRSGSWAGAGRGPARGGRRAGTSSSVRASSSEMDEFVGRRRRTQISPTNSRTGRGAGVRRGGTGGVVGCGWGPGGVGRGS